MKPRINLKREFARITESARLEAKKILFDAINMNMVLHWTL